MDAIELEWKQMDDERRKHEQLEDYDPKKEAQRTSQFIASREWYYTKLYGYFEKTGQYSRKQVLPNLYSKVAIGISCIWDIDFDVWQLYRAKDKSEYILVNRFEERYGNDPKNVIIIKELTDKIHGTDYRNINLFKYIRDYESEEKIKNEQIIKEIL